MSFDSADSLSTVRPTFGSRTAKDSIQKLHHNNFNFQRRSDTDRAASLRNHRVRAYTQGKVTSQKQWSRYDRHFLGVTLHNVWR